MPNIKQKLRYIPFDIFIAVLIALIGFSSFALGWIARGEQKTHPVTVERIPFSNAETAGLFVGSVNSDKYHYRWCGGGQRISPENRLYFNSVEEAEAAGYEPASNCPGL
ncbi:MAG: hypothetical protein WD335_02170 [Candidatus Paceibacterota bacterium]